MLVIVPDILTPAELEQIRKGVAASEFVDGRATAGPRTAAIKRNLETNVRSEGQKELQELVLRALMRNSTFVAVVAPKRILPVRFNLYKTGMHYGDHVDNAIMGGSPGEPDAVRVDMSFTLFISPPESYDGGELVIKSGFGRHTFKLPAGHLVTYPTYHLHEVTPVTRGERLVVVSWMQSMIRDPLKRELLLDLALLGQSLATPAKNASRGDLDLLDRVRKNLLRMWAEN